MLEKLTQFEKELKEVEEEIQSPDALSNPRKLAELSKKHRTLKDIVKEFEVLKRIESHIKEAEEVSKNEPEMAEVANEELKKLNEIKKEQEETLRRALIPSDPADEKNVIVEIRAGAGGDEAALFAAELFRMYHRYAEKNHWKVEIMDSSETEGNGFKEVIAEIKGSGAYSKLKYESGVHRVQRVPETESQGRVHTSTVTVAILPEAEEVDIDIDPKDIRVDVFHSGGAGGQSVNTADSAVRITYLPTGMIVTCQKERSQLKNKERAMSVLRSRLYEEKLKEEAKKRGDARKSQIGTGDRSEKIRTYNFPQDRITDHRISFSASNVSGFMNGNIEPMIDALISKSQENALKDS